MAKSVISIPRESVELVVVNVSVDGVPVTNFKVAAVRTGQRPTSWSDATVIDGQAGLLTGDLEQGLWDVYVRVESTPEVVVVKSGEVQIQ